jgi:CheY-like chemotaxis protein/uncharacterized coiled-coil protein SlyX
MDWTIVATLGTILGIGKVVELSVKEWISRRRNRQALDATNEGKQIDADQAFMAKLMARQDVLEKQIQDLNNKHMALTETNAQLKFENTELRRTNAEQSKQITDLTAQLTETRIELARLEERIRHLDKSEAEPPKPDQEKVELERENLLLKGSQAAKRSVVPVLIIDDNQDSREVLKASFEVSDIECETIENGPDALKWLAANEARVIVTDMAMSAMDGIGLVRQVRRIERSQADRKAAYIVVYTGHRIDAVIKDLKEKENGSGVVQAVYEKAKVEPAELVEKVRELALRSLEK